MQPLERSLKIGNPSTIDLEKPVLILTVGLPRSGKSTWAKEQGVPIVNPDAVRLAIHGKPFLADAEPWVWVTVKTMIKSLFYAGHFVVILDAANTTIKRRSDWNNPLWRVALKMFKTDPDTCIKRAADNDRADLISSITRMHAEWQDPVPGQEPPLLDQVMPFNGL